MTCYSRIDFARLCGVESRHLSNYIKRGKVVLTGELVDDKHPTNSSFLQKRREKILQIETVYEIEEKPQQALQTEKKINIQPVIPDKQPKQNLTQYQLEAEIKKADLAKKEVDTRIALLKEEKLMGVSIPTDLVKVVIANLSKSIISAFKDGADNFLIEISKRKSLSISEIAECRGELIKIINTSSTRAISESKRNVKSIINEYSVKRGVGEHD